MNGMLVDMRTPLVMGHVEKAEQLVNDVMHWSQEVGRLYALEREAHEIYRAADQSFEDALGGAIAEIDYEANINKTGKLAGIARTSDAYKRAVSQLRSELMVTRFQGEHAALLRAERVYQDASIAYEQAKVRLGALQTVAKLQSSILQAFSAS